MQRMIVWRTAGQEYCLSGVEAKKSLLRNSLLLTTENTPGGLSWPFPTSYPANRDIFPSLGLRVENKQGGN